MGNNDFKVGLGVQVDGKDLQPQIDKLAKGLKELDIKVDSASLKKVSVTYDEIAKTEQKIQTITGELVNQQGQLLSATVKVDNATGEIISTKTKLIQKTKEETKAIEQAKKELERQNSIYSNIIANTKKIGELKLKQVSADKNESTEIQRQIVLLEKRNGYYNKQLTKKNLKSNDLDREVNKTKEIYDWQLKVNKAKASDKSNSKATKQADNDARANEKLANSMGVVSTRAKTASTNFATYQNSLKSSALKDYAPEIDRISTSFKKAASSGKQIDLSKANSQLSEFKSKMRLAGNETKTLTTKIKENIGAFSNWYIIAGVVSGAIGLIKKAGTTVVDLDSKVTDLAQATGGTRESAQNLLSTYIDMGEQLGATGSEVSSSADEWLRQGQSISNTNTLIKDSLVLSKIGQLDSADSTKYLTSAMKGYKVEAKDVIGIVDKLSAVDMKSATSAGGLAEAMSQTANNARISGVSMNKLLGILAVVGETTGESMSSVGNSFSTIFSRMANIKLKSLSDPEQASQLNNVETSLNNVDIKLRKNKTTFRNFGDVLDDINGKWKNLSDVNKRAIAVSIAGKQFCLSM